jgi:sensor histidine kinase YesM
MRLVNRKSAYFWCQLIGWGGILSLNLFFTWTFRGEITWQAWTRILIWAFTGLAFTHFMRGVLLRLKVLQKEFESQLLYFIGLTAIFSILAGSVLQFFVSNFSLLDPADITLKNTNARFINYVFNYFFTLLIWNLIYFIFHYMERLRNQQIEALKSEALIRELQLQTIKSHINPHFIFNSLNSIRALIDENPKRARTAITELSNILRSSMQAEKVETVAFEKELNIVKDYLELEKLRFEERLHFRLEIDPSTLHLQVPPMMLQTLVENAIKHGVSRHLSGGEVVVSSKIQEHFHELKILNTGSLNGSYNKEGFGVSSTKERLQLQYGDKASFELSEKPEGYVQAMIRMPVENVVSITENRLAHA